MLRSLPRGPRGALAMCPTEPTPDQRRRSVERLRAREALPVPEQLADWVGEVAAGAVSVPSASFESERMQAYVRVGGHTVEGVEHAALIVARLWVHPACRRQGHASAFLRRALAEASSRGAAWELVVAEQVTSEHAQRWLRREGWQEDLARKQAHIAGLKDLFGERRFGERRFGGEVSDGETSSDGETFSGETSGREASSGETSGKDIFGREEVPLYRPTFYEWTPSE